MFELAGVQEDVAKEAVRLAANKLPIKTRFRQKGRCRWCSGMKVQEFRELNDGELEEKLKELKEELFNLSSRQRPVSLRMSGALKRCAGVLPGKNCSEERAWS